MLCTPIRTPSASKCSEDFFRLGKAVKTKLPPPHPLWRSVIREWCAFNHFSPSTKNISINTIAYIQVAFSQSFLTNRTLERRMYVKDKLQRLGITYLKDLINDKIRNRALAVTNGFFKRVIKAMFQKIPQAWKDLLADKLNVPPPTHMYANLLPLTKVTT